MLDTIHAKLWIWLHKVNHPGFTIESEDGSVGKLSEPSVLVASNSSELSETLSFWLSCSESPHFVGTFLWCRIFGTIRGNDKKIEAWSPLLCVDGRFAIFDGWIKYTAFSLNLLLARFPALTIVEHTFEESREYWLAVSMSRKLDQLLVASSCVATTI